MYVEPWGMQERPFAIFTGASESELSAGNVVEVDGEVFTAHAGFVDNHDILLTDDLSRGHFEGGGREGVIHDGTEGAEEFQIDEVSGGF